VRRIARAGDRGRFEYDIVDVVVDAEAPEILERPLEVGCRERPLVDVTGGSGDAREM